MHGLFVVAAAVAAFTCGCTLDTLNSGITSVLECEPSASAMGVDWDLALCEAMGVRATGEFHH
jgi:hypothetical protein